MTCNPTRNFGQGLLVDYCDTSTYYNAQVNSPTPIPSRLSARQLRGSVKPLADARTIKEIGPKSKKL